MAHRDIEGLGAVVMAPQGLWKEEDKHGRATLLWSRISLRTKADEDVLEGWKEVTGYKDSGAVGPQASSGGTWGEGSQRRM